MTTDSSIATHPAALARSATSRPSLPITYNASPPRRTLFRRFSPWLIAFIICCAWDRAVYLLISSNNIPKLEWLEKLMMPEVLRDSLAHAAHFSLPAIGNLLLGLTYAVIYLFGRIYLWPLLALLFIFRHWGGTDGTRVRAGLRRGVFIFLIPATSGLLAELLKLITRRQRPEYIDGFYHFLPWPRTSPLSPDFWNPATIGLASSHAAVAFGGALAAGLLLPRWRIPLYILATLCALSRIAVGAHYLSDTLAGAAIAFATFSLIYTWDKHNNHGSPITP
jgi:membrane-associated phospholipid phosphatase